MTEKVPTQLFPMNVERSFKKERRKQCSEDEVFGKTDLRRERQDRENDPCRNQADAVREAKSPGQHRDDSGDQKQQRSGLKIEFHEFRFACSPPTVSIRGWSRLLHNHLATSIGTSPGQSPAQD